MYKRKNFQPDFQRLINVLHHQKTDKDILFEFFINDEICYQLADDKFKTRELGTEKYLAMLMNAYKNAGYDYFSVPAWQVQALQFTKGEVEQKSTKSLNEGAVISDRESFEKYQWPDPEDTNIEIYHKISKDIPDGMKALACSWGGVLENVIELVGFEKLCIMMMMDEELTTAIFDEVGSRLLRYYELLAPIDTIGAFMGNDDWGFKTQTMFSPESMEKYVFPWHKKIVETIHKAGKPAILHSCGNLKPVMDTIIDDLKYDGKHSYEDEIYPVEQAIDWWGNRIAIMGGMDMDFLARKNPEQIHKRALNLLEKTRNGGGYALGSGNSIADYISYDNFIAMISAVDKG